jgi:hypothetical protein
MAAPRALQTLVDRYDAEVFAPARRIARVRLAVADGDAFDAILAHGTTRLERQAGTADAMLTADRRTWAAIAQDLRGGMAASTPVASRSPRPAPRRRVPGGDHPGATRR